MNDVVLDNSTGVPLIDDTVRAIVGAFEHAFPSRIRAYYLIGSYVEQTAVPLSDLDCCVIFRDHVTSPQEQIEVQHLVQQCAGLSPVRLDLSTVPESGLDALAPFFQVALKLGSKLVYGTDIRHALSLPAFAAYTDDVIAGAHHFIARLRGATQLTVPCVTYPDAPDEFFGYTGKSIATWYPTTVTAGTKEVVATVSRIATAIVVDQAQHYVPGKQQAIQLFQQHIGGLWAGFVADVFERCKHDWHYLVPEAPQERQQLRVLCQQMLAFENAFLERYPVPS